MNHSLLRYTIIFALPLAACNAPREEPQDAPPTESPTQAAPGSAAGDPSVVHHPEPPRRPQEKRDSMQMEGNWEPFTARLVQPTTDLPFSTYLPKDMEFEQQSSGEGDGFYFHTKFGGQRRENSFMLVFMLPQGATAADARRFAEAFQRSHAHEPQIAHVQLGSHQGRHFYVARTYPREFSEGIGPRTHYIRSQWIWLNDGRSLESTLQPPLE
jgi:hypothetical protein